MYKYMNDAYIKILKALADPIRLQMVLELVGKGEISCQESSKSFDLSQPTISHHYKKLTDAGIIKMRKDGVNHFYELDEAYLKKLGINLKTFVSNS